MEQQDEEKQKIKAFSVWGLAWELGWQIAVPLVGFALIGRWGDREFDTSPWFLVVGVVFAAMFSSYLVYRKVVKILK